MNLVSYSSQLLLRYFRNGESAGNVNYNVVRLAKDLEYLRLYWAVSPSIEDLCRYLLDHRFEIQASSESFLETSDLSVKGRLAAKETVLLRAVTGRYSSVAYYSHKKSFLNGPNQVLIWVIGFARRYSSKWRDLISQYNTSWLAEARIHTTQVVKIIEEAYRIQLIREMFREKLVNARPTGNSLQKAKLSRRRVYKLAYEAYASLTRIERGDKNELDLLLSSTLIRPLEDYQLLELSLALSMAEGLSRHLGMDVVISEIVPRFDSIVLRVGHISISWQTRTSSFIAPQAEPSELILNNLLPFYGLNTSVNRPDIIVKNETTGKILAIGEAKSYRDRELGWRDAVREALAQIINYSRGYESGQDQIDLISRSIVGVSYYPMDQRPPNFPVEGPIVMDSNDIISSSIDSWLIRIESLL